jgi:hypothetical protein
MICHNLQKAPVVIQRQIIPALHTIFLNDFWIWILKQGLQHQKLWSIHLLKGGSTVVLEIK